MIRYNVRYENSGVFCIQKHTWPRMTRFDGSIRAAHTVDAGHELARFFASLRMTGKGRGPKAKVCAELRF